MVFKCLCSIGYCFEVHDGVVLQHLLKQEVRPGERYYFFSELISVAQPQNFLCFESKSGQFGWVLKCEEKNFLSPKFVQMLMLRLVFVCTKLKSISESNSKIWTSGLFWCNGDGVETLVAIVSTSKVIVFMQQCKPEYDYKLLKHRSFCINLIRQLQHETCPLTFCKEYFIHPTQFKALIEVKDYALVPVNEVYDAIKAENMVIVAECGVCKLKRLFYLILMLYSAEI